MYFPGIYSIKMVHFGKLIEVKMNGSFDHQIETAFEEMGKKS
jgi:hypothetical protein